jgi:hypothetical protein
MIDLVLAGDTTYFGGWYIKIRVEFLVVET